MMRPWWAMWRERARRWRQPPTPVTRRWNSKGHTALLLAAVRGSDRVARLLLEAAPEAAMMSCGDEGWLPVHVGEARGVFEGPGNPGVFVAVTEALPCCRSINGQPHAPQPVLLAALLAMQPPRRGTQSC